MLQERVMPLLPYGMLLTRVFMRAQLPSGGHRKDDKCPATTMKTFSSMGLKPQGLEKEEKKKKKEEEKKREKKKGEKKKDLRKKDSSSQKVRCKPSKEKRLKKGNKREVSHQSLKRGE